MTKHKPLFKLLRLLGNKGKTNRFSGWAIQPTEVKGNRIVFGRQSFLGSQKVQMQTKAAAALASKIAVERRSEKLDRKARRKALLRRGDVSSVVHHLGLSVSEQNDTSPSSGGGGCSGGGD